MENVRSGQETKGGKWLIGQITSHRSCGHEPFLRMLPPHLPPAAVEMGIEQIWAQQVVCCRSCCANCTSPLKTTPSTGKHSWIRDCFAVWQVSMETGCVQAACEAVTSPSGYSHQCQLQESSNRRRPLRTHMHACMHTGIFVRTLPSNGPLKFRGPAKMSSLPKN